MRGGLNVCSTEQRLHFYPLDEPAKLRSVHRGFAKECDTNIPETRCIDSSHEAVQVLAGSSVSKARESRENNRSPDGGGKSR